MKKLLYGAAAIALLLGAGAFLLPFVQTPADTDEGHLSAGLVIPKMDAVAGRALFASKGCAVCHSINGVGGEDAPPLDAEYMDTPMNPFNFAARMWRGAETMVFMQREELGDVIELDGDELAAIIAFVHDADEQANFSVDDLPQEIADLISGAHAEQEGEGAHD
ncbi:MAG: cytochrome c [Halocynthiibacter sp.]